MVISLLALCASIIYFVIIVSFTSTRVLRFAIFLHHQFTIKFTTSSSSSPLRKPGFGRLCLIIIIIIYCFFFFFFSSSSSSIFLSISTQPIVSPITPLESAMLCCSKMFSVLAESPCCDVMKSLATFWPIGIVVKGEGCGFCPPASS